jgi:hypothetical protein
LVNDGPLDVLPDPPRGIGTEPKPPLVVKFFDRLDQSEITLFDDIREGEPAVDVALPDADHQAEV